MKQTTLFVCDICKASYLTEEEALNCEKKHIKIKGIKAPFYFHGMKYPESITLEMENGEIIKYTKDHDMGIFNKRRGWK